mmetsp:Transcript_49263/g.56598  ORF Transcript_49263/g.56598 Transcript_49263/m.56598 type:complete len:154 (+) Transcript_49263:741-1202(+)
MKLIALAFFVLLAGSSCTATAHRTHSFLNKHERTGHPKMGEGCNDDHINRFVTNAKALIEKLDSWSPSTLSKTNWTHVLQAISEVKGVAITPLNDVFLLITETPAICQRVQDTVESYLNTLKRNKLPGIDWIDTNTVYPKAFKMVLTNPWICF